jgi:hypothetical protein
MFGPPTIPPIQPWHQDVGGVADLAEDGDAFGLALSVGDFDADEFEDLAIGVPEEDLAVPPIFTLIRRDAGVLHVLHGGPTGLNVSGSQLWNQNGLGEAPQSFDWFGRALAAGDFNEDGRDDLAIGAPLEGFTGSPNAGLVHTLWGTLNGLTSLFTQQWHQDLPALGHDREPNDAFGMTLFSGDFDGDGAYDLAIGATGEDANAGAVQVLYGPALLGGTQRLSRSILGHVSKPGDRFGGA